MGARMEKICENGRAKAIGVCNSSVKNLEKLIETAKVVPAVNQVELYPFLVQQDLKDYCDKKGMVLTVFACTVIYAWHITRGHDFLSRSSNEERQKESLNLPALSAGMSSA
ncbi:NADP-dependent oxidoreductase domain-containing protein [Daedaleopsis nitida]|nr:NADP-dependent oxidoreductase domain-containing protein [Daedaleopsis nitida]